MIFSEVNKKNIEFKKILIEYENKIALRYSFKAFNKNPILKNVISKEQFYDIIDKANIIICDAKMKKAKFDKVEIGKITYLIIIISFIFTIIYTITFYYSPRSENDQIKLKICGIIFFSLSLFLLFCIEIFFSFRKIKGDRCLYDFYRDEMLAYLNYVNEKWKGKMIFSYDENTKNITCNLIIDEKLKNIINSSSKSSSGSESSESEIDTSSVVTSKSNSRSKSRSSSSITNNKILNLKENK